MPLRVWPPLSGGVAPLPGATTARLETITYASDARGVSPVGRIGPMENLEWRDGVDRLLQVADRFAGMWGSASLRILGTPSGERQLDAYVTSITARFADGPASSKVVLTDPTLIDAVLEWPAFIELMSAWRSGQQGAVGDWRVAPVFATDRCTWWPLDQETSLRTSHFEPRRQTPYRMWRLESGGGGAPQTFQQQVYETQRNLGMDMYEWAAEYLGIPWGVTTLQFTMDAPLGVALAATRINDNASITVWHRPPIAPNDIWLRVGAGRWEAARAKVPLEGGSPDDGWLVSHGVAQAQSADATAWAGLESQGDAPLWSLAIRPEASVMAVDLAPLRALDAWYGLGGRSLGEDVFTSADQSRRSGHAAERFEVGLANACASLGHQVIFGGKALSTPGVDFLSFDPQTRVAYLISATIANDIRSKLLALLLVVPTMTQAIGPGWTVKPVIAVSVDRTQLLESELGDAATKQVTVLTSQDFVGLAENPPSVEGLRAALERSPSFYPAGLGQNTPRP